MPNNSNPNEPRKRRFHDGRKGRAARHGSNAGAPEPERQDDLFGGLEGAAQRTAKPGTPKPKDNSALAKMRWMIMAAQTWSIRTSSSMPTGSMPLDPASRTKQVCPPDPGCKPVEKRILVFSESLWAGRIVASRAGLQFTY